MLMVNQVGIIPFHKSFFFNNNVLWFDTNNVYVEKECVGKYHENVFT